MGYTIYSAPNKVKFNDNAKLQFGTGPGADSDGDTQIYSDGTSLILDGPVKTTGGVASGTQRDIVANEFTQTAVSDTITNTDSETDFSVTATIPANALSAGSTVRIRVGGATPSTNGTDTLTLQLYFGGEIIATTAPVDVANNNGWYFDCVATIRTAGASGTFVSDGLSYLGASLAPHPQASAAVNTTTAVVVKVSAVWSAASESNQVIQNQMVIDIG